MNDEITNHDVDEKYLCILLGLIIEMRRHQRMYFAYRKEDDKRKAISAEKKVDVFCMRMTALKYKPITETPDQNELF